MVTLGGNRYGKAEVRVVHVGRAAGPGGSDLVRDWNVSSSLSGDLADTHLTGDNSKVLATDTQKNTVYAMAKKLGGIEPEAFALELAAHYTGSQEAISRARIAIQEYPWVPVAGTGHSFARSGQYTRTVTTLDDAYDRILATVVSAQWRFRDTSADWSAAFPAALDALIGAFARTESYSLQQTLFAMGSAILAAVPQVREVRLALPNKHHFVVDLSPFGMANENEVYDAADRPYGLIEGTVLADDAPDAGIAWS